MDGADAARRLHVEGVGNRGGEGSGSAFGGNTYGVPGTFWATKLPENAILPDPVITENMGRKPWP